MEEILSRCGYRCDLCLAYRPNVEKNPSNQQVLSDGWFKYFGFRVEPENILCEGCMGDQPKTIDQECTVRPCVIVKGLDNCASCDQFACDKLKERLVEFESIKKRISAEIPDADRIRFIQPYENMERFDKIRQDNNW
jgi:hypothetical protein